MLLSLQTMREKLEEFRLLQDPMFKSLCRFFNLTKLEGWREATRSKGACPIDTYFRKLTTFTEADTSRGWAVDRYRAFRNWYSRRNADYRWLLMEMAIDEDDVVIDYGCSISAFAYYAMRTKLRINLTLADVPSPHFEFCKYFYRGFVREFVEINPGHLPLENMYSKILVLDVLEHVPSPLKLSQHLVQHLLPGGRLVETFISVTEFRTNPSNLESALAERDETLKFLQENLRLRKGELGRAAGPRIWEKP